MPLLIYKMISKDYEVKHLKCISFEMTKYDGTNITTLGKTTLYSRHSRINQKIIFQIAHSGNITLHGFNDGQWFAYVKFLDNIDKKPHQLPDQSKKSEHISQIYSMALAHSQRRTVISVLIRMYHPRGQLLDHCH